MAGQGSSPSMASIPVRNAQSPGPQDVSINRARSSPKPTSNHRQSWSQDLRGMPPSPRSQRHASLSQQSLQELLAYQPPAIQADNPFSGRDWRRITIGEVIDPGEVHFAELDTSVEDATNLLVDSGAPNVILIRQDKRTRAVTSTFDYSDLNAYLLVILGLVQPLPDDENGFHMIEVARKGRERKEIPLRDIQSIGRREPIVTLPHTETLKRAVELLGSGVHRILVTRGNTHEVGGVLTQLRLVRFFWENARNFPEIDRLYPASLMDLHQVGSKGVVSINGDRPLTDALKLMSDESITSLPVLDNHHNVVGNISHVDVKLLIKSTSLPLLKSSCIHFISVILSEQGMNDGKDSFPVFYVAPHSSLAHSVAKLVATRSHRMWIVDSTSPAPSAPPTPTASSVTAPPSLLNATTPTPTPPYTPVVGSTVPASSLPGQHMSGRLSGVISLTDVLNLVAKAGGLAPHEPDEARRQRRRSSSSSLRMSMDSARSSSVDLSRSGSMSGSRR
ncbi:MAG: cell separation during budding [Chrysothrix sp. TS-e1954]|nr:MAG: cell separation during budding [Chrysothrix sp. TS-e1954]